MVEDGLRDLRSADLSRLRFDADAEDDTEDEVVGERELARDILLQLE